MLILVVKVYFYDFHEIDIIIPHTILSSEIKSNEYFNQKIYLQVNYMKCENKII